MGDLPILMNTKLYRPPIPADFVYRAGLLDRLKHALSQPLTLIAAPAGYGKTTLASAWLEGLECPNTWLSLDERDDCLDGFLAYFLAAIQSIFPDAVLQTRSLLEAPSLPALQVIVRCLSNDLFQLDQPFVLVFDDYSTIRDSAVHQLIAELLQHPPQSMHLVLTCRHDPPLPINRLRARHQMVEIRRPELRFSRAEIETFMQYVTGAPISERSVAILEEKTEGWAAGLRLAALSLVQSVDMEESFTNMEEDNRFVLEYLAGEVISGLPKEIREFLLATSILERLCGPLCDHVIAQEGPEGISQSHLKWLESANLFTVALDNQQTWYRYHRLFREILKFTLSKERGSEEVAQLHARASAWYSEHAYVEEAISHALASGDENLVIQLVEAHRHEAINQERWQQIERWLRLIPRRVIDERPELLMLEAWTMNRSEQYAEVSASLSQVEALLEKKTFPDALSKGIRAEIYALRSQQSCWRSDIQGALRFARCALDEAGEELSYVRGLAWMVLAIALHMKGDLNGAFDAVYEGLREDRYHNNTFPTRLLIALGSIHWAEADLVNLIQTAEYLLKLAQERDLPESISWAHYLLGCAHYQRNDLEAAENHFSFVVHQPPAAKSSFTFSQSVFGLAATYQARGLSEQARAVVESAKPIALQNTNPAMVAEIQAVLARLDLMQGKSVEAQRWSMYWEGRFQPSAVPAFHYPLVTQVQILIDQGTPESLNEAEELLADLRVKAEGTNNTLFRMLSLALHALLHDACEEEEDALSMLNQSIHLAQPGGILRFYIDLGPRMASLLGRLYRQGIAPVYLKEILHLFPSHKPTSSNNGSQVLIEPLTDRELEILALLAQRLSNKEIARELVISPMTVKRHTINIYQKLNASSRREAVDVAAALGLFDLQDPVPLIEFKELFHVR